MKITKVLLLSFTWVISIAYLFGPVIIYAQASTDPIKVKESVLLKESSQGEHHLARLERMAHDYVYAYNTAALNQKLIQRMRDDDLEVVDSFQDNLDGTAAIVVRDITSGQHTIVFRGTDDLEDALGDVSEATYGEVGLGQYGRNHEIFDRWAADYSTDSKFDVTGHSLGGGLAGIFTSVHTSKIRRTALFQAPAQGVATNRRFDANISKGNQPDIYLIVASPDGVALAGNRHIGKPTVIVASADNMGLKKIYGHGSFLLQNSGFINTWYDDNKGYRDSNDGLKVREMSYSEYFPIRELIGSTVTDNNISEVFKKTDQIDRLLKDLILIRDFKPLLDQVASADSKKLLKIKQRAKQRVSALENLFTEPQLDWLVYHYEDLIELRPSDLSISKATNTLEQLVTFRNILYGEEAEHTISGFWNSNYGCVHITAVPRLQRFNGYLVYTNGNAGTLTLNRIDSTANSYNYTWLNDANYGTGQFVASHDNLKGYFTVEDNPDKSPWNLTRVSNCTITCQRLKKAYEYLDPEKLSRFFQAGQRAVNAKGRNQEEYKKACDQMNEYPNEFGSMKNAIHSNCSFGLARTMGLYNVCQ